MYVRPTTINEIRQSMLKWNFTYLMKIVNTYRDVGINPNELKYSMTKWNSCIQCRLSIVDPLMPTVHKLILRFISSKDITIVIIFRILILC